jgi:hypothetical protein
LIMKKNADSAKIEQTYVEMCHEHHLEIQGKKN